MRAFTFGNDRTPFFNRGTALLDRKVPGCGGGALAKDGTLCPSVNPPGVVLSSDQVTCVERFTSCDVNVGELVACQRHAAFDLCLQARSGVLRTVLEC